MFLTVLSPRKTQPNASQSNPSQSDVGTRREELIAKWRSEGRIAPDETFGDAYMYVGAWVPNLSGKTDILSEKGCLHGLAFATSKEIIR